ncbi:microtubule motor protein [Kwoniella mangroviensis CBS 10435]|uniref:Microtubule motor protein n=1 Tax=Kwoniella mangroviensis CBS 10435 TaxID=1331196 RepID=A0A1B9IF91_9TREE|nr:microtubule motor protein [Kwoniella mangroviensis CBS 10435]
MTTISKAISCHVRLRPSHPNDGKTNPDSIKISGNRIEALNKEGDKRYHFDLDKCHGQTSTQEEIFGSVRLLIEQVYNGQNSTIFTYGVTGSGKTHTMQGSRSDPGIIPRTVQAIFQKRSEMRSSISNIAFSYVEILKDEVYDLLGDRFEPRKRDIRMSAEGQNIISDLIVQPINSVTEFEILYDAASKTRKTACTKLNSSSSRSHAILTLYLDMIEDHNPSNRKSGKICLTDLAGSENNNLTGNDKERMRESSAINTSLTTLGKVVDALNLIAERGNRDSAGVFIPYRESKLTRLLQDALGGTSQGLLICCLAPGEKFARDTINTLQFARKSKAVENRIPVVDNSQRRASAPLPRAIKPINGNAAFKVHVAPRQSAPTGGRTALSSISTNYRPARTMMGRNQTGKENGLGVFVKQEKGSDLKGLTDELLDQRIQKIVSQEMEKERTPPSTANRSSNVISELPKTESSNGQNDVDPLSAADRDARARVIVSHARKSHHSGDLQQALSLYRKAYEYVPSNRKLSIRITEIQLALEGILPPEPKSQQTDEIRKSGMKRSFGHLDNLADTSQESPMKKGKS